MAQKVPKSQRTSVLGCGWGLSCDLADAVTTECAALGAARWRRHRLHTRAGACPTHISAFTSPQKNVQEIPWEEGGVPILFLTPKNKWGVGSFHSPPPRMTALGQRTLSWLRGHPGPRWRCTQVEGWLLECRGTSRSWGTAFPPRHTGDPLPGGRAAALLLSACPEGGCVPSWAARGHCLDNRGTSK